MRFFEENSLENFAKSADFCEKMPFFTLEKRKCLIDSLSLSLSLSLSNIYLYTFYCRKNLFFLLNRSVIFVPFCIYLLKTGNFKI